MIRAGRWSSIWAAQDFLPRYKLYVSHIAEWRQQFQNVQSVDLRYEGQVIVNPDKTA